jgi:hypothetical protein
MKLYADSNKVTTQHIIAHYLFFIPKFLIVGKIKNASFQELFFRQFKFQSV